MVVLGGGAVFYERGTPVGVGVTARGQEGEVDAVREHTYTLHPTPYTLHPTPYALHPTTNTLHPTPYTLQPWLEPPEAAFRFQPTGAKTGCTQGESQPTRKKIIKVVGVGAVGGLPRAAKREESESERWTPCANTACIEGFGFRV